MSAVRTERAGSRLLLWVQALSSCCWTLHANITCQRDTEQIDFIPWYDLIWLLMSLNNLFLLFADSFINSVHAITLIKKDRPQDRCHHIDRTRDHQHKIMKGRFSGAGERTRGVGQMDTDQLIS